MNGKIPPALEQYKASDSDAGSIQYYGFLRNDGGWYIMKMSGGNTYRYQVGGSGYATAWAARASLGYDYFNLLF